MAGLNEVAARIAKDHNVTISSAKELITGTLSTIVELAEEDVVRIGKHTFKTVERAARTCRNPRTGEAVEVAARKVITYKYTKPKTLVVAPAPEPKKKSKK